MSDQPRLPRVEPDRAAEEVRPTFDAFMRERGKVPNLYRIAAHAPRITSRLAALQTAVMGPGEVPVLLKELLSARLAHQPVRLLTGVPHCPGRAAGRDTGATRRGSRRVV